VRLRREHRGRGRLTWSSAGRASRRSVDSGPDAPAPPASSRQWAVCPAPDEKTARARTAAPLTAKKKSIRRETWSGLETTKTSRGAASRRDHASPSSGCARQDREDTTSPRRPRHVEVQGPPKSGPASSRDADRSTPTAPERMARIRGMGQRGCEDQQPRVEPLGQGGGAIVDPELGGDMHEEGLTWPRRMNSWAAVFVAVLASLPGRRVRAVPTAGLAERLLGGRAHVGGGPITRVARRRDRPPSRPRRLARRGEGAPAVGRP